jgi:C4-dicarboxylate-specific signal transduction histidine kinase
MSDNTAELSSAEAFLKKLMRVVGCTALAEMASGVAHELNQPLAAIATFSNAGERMLDRPEPLVERASGVFRDVSHEALGAGERLQSIRRLFDQEPASQDRCQMSDLIAEMRPVLNSLGRHCKITTCFAGGESVPDIRVDRLRIQNVLLVLVQNAIDATSQVVGERVIQIDVSAERYTVETGVSDSGPGVPGHLTERLFRPFFTTKPRGTGLGLASSRSIVESHEGTIGFQNRAAGGVRFWFRLPVAQD